MQVIKSHSMILWELLLINMGVYVLVDVVIGGKTIPQGVVLPLATPLEMVKIKNIECLKEENKTNTF